MSCPFNEEQLLQLKAFIELCKSQPQILQHPKLSFFKDYLTSLGVTISPSAFNFGSKPFAPAGDTASNNAEDIKQSSSDAESEMESDVELDMTGVIDPDPLDASQVMGDLNKETTEEERDQSDEKRMEAMKAFSEQQFDEAIKLYTEAINLNPQSALLFAKRGQVYLKLNKPNACIKDCTHALELNCDSAAAYKFRGRAYRLLGKFEEASHDLCESLKIDYDDQTNEWLNEVKPNAEKLRQHKLSMQRKMEEKQHREKLGRARKAQEARAHAAQAQAEAESKADAADPSGANIRDYLANLMRHPELMKAFEDPELMAAFQDVSLNPANFVKYQNNPRIMDAIEKMQALLSKASGQSSGNRPNAAGFEPKPPTDDDVGLD